MYRNYGKSFQYAKRQRQEWIYLTYLSTKDRINIKM